ncbi:hypothetical protein M092_1022 [Parabacteroides distasonis str. 3776 D15 iv]|uniref:Uncharacterized protein n=1 Tax=Parabacteroides distasonis str. 3776 D15 i TaxID=1339342 RepID=A0AB34LA18_PARDI|nr:hypothetical protein M091_4385 [Parabacteroides distasonis str. 3776 D15 i]KDS72272.1 hypothetical protein M092_1022 [Parabacteroides distasonis str. 3776 D15 iv]
MLKAVAGSVDIQGITQDTCGDRRPTLTLGVGGPGGQWPKSLGERNTQAHLAPRYAEGTTDETFRPEQALLLVVAIDGLTVANARD